MCSYVSWAAKVNYRCPDQKLFAQTVSDFFNKKGSIFRSQKIKLIHVNVTGPPGYIG
jgi:hypothetical protein